MAELEALGLSPLLEPMLRIETEHDASIDLSDCRAILFTSANGARSFATFTNDRSLPVVAVGSASAAAAEELGFTDVTVAGGDVEKLAESVQVRFPDPKPSNGPHILFHAAGSVTAGDLKSTLDALGYSVRRAVLYRAEPAQSLSEKTKEALNSGTVWGIPVFSPRTARILVNLIEQEGYRQTVDKIHFFALSPAVRDGAACLPWKAMHVAATPTREALISTLQAVMNKSMTS